MKSLLAKLADRPAPPIAPEEDPPRPETHVFAVGDIHGRMDLVEPLLERIDTRIDAWEADDACIVFLGDYIDRGPDSGAVIDRLREVEAASQGRAICLMGNHEQMMLEFLDDPGKGPRWLRNGGVQTAESFGLSANLGDAPEPAALADLRDALAEALPEGTEAWLRALPLSWSSGTLWATHAGADPTLPMGRQSPRSLIWGHPMFGAHPRSDGMWIVHGHTVLTTPRARGGRISVDTGAVYGGPLTAAAVRPDGRVEFVAAPGRRL